MSAAYGPPPPPHPYGPQPSQALHPAHGPIAHYGHAAAVQPSARTVYGMPLEPGERVLYYHRADRNPAVWIVMGVLLIPFLIGFFLIAHGATMKRKVPYAQVVTNRRLVALNAFGQIIFPDQMRWPDVAGVYVRRVNGAISLIGVHNGKGRRSTFDRDVYAVQRFLDRVCSDTRLLETLPEVSFDPLPR